MVGLIHEIGGCLRLKSLGLTSQALQPTKAGGDRRISQMLEGIDDIVGPGNLPSTARPAAATSLQPASGFPHQGAQNAIKSSQGEPAKLYSNSVMTKSSVTSPGLTVGGALKGRETDT